MKNKNAQYNYKKQIIKVEIPFTIQTSHNIEQIDFKGINQIKIDFKKNKFYLKDKNKNFEIELELESSEEALTHKFYITCKGENINEEDIERICFLLESLFSYILDYQNLNRHYGNFFIKIDRFNIKIDYEIKNNEIVLKDKVYLKDKLFMKLESFKRIEFDSEYIINDDFILQTYYEALKAPNPKLKYFDLFLILEYIENSKRYKKRFLNDNEFLFKMEDFEKVKSCFSKFQYERLLQLVNNKSFTKKSRAEKLYLILKEYGVLCISTIDKQGKLTKEELTQENIKKIIEIRNKIFHSSQNEFFEKILWWNLFPLCENIVGKNFKRRINY